MGTRGYKAYRYKGKYYRQYIPHSSYPDGEGSDILGSIPRNPAALEKWIARVSSKLDEEYTNDVCTDASWTLGDLWIQWTYVIDFDNRVFTVNGLLHFKFDNLPPLRTSGSKIGFAGYFREGPDGVPLREIPKKHLASLEFWSKFTFDAEKTQQEYSALQPTVVALSEWNAPTWDTLSVAQHLSASLIKTLVYDYSDELAICYYSSMWPKLGIFCWNVANAAATARLLCPPSDTLPQSDTAYLLNIDYLDDDRISGPDVATHFQLQHKGIMGRFCWFRGCLITFCPRLDDPAYMTHKVVQIIRHLRRNNRAQAVGIIMSGWHVVAVTVDESNVRRSPVLDLHDGKEPKEGALVLMHLLSPTFTRSKAPWLAPLELHTQPHSNCSVVPDEILRHIIHFTDFDTYLRLPLVSRYFRSIYLAHPRIGNHTLLRYKGVSPNAESLFRIQSTSSMDSWLAALKRVKVSMPESRKTQTFWKYRTRFYFIEPVIREGLAGMFQRHQTGTKSLTLAPTVLEETKGAHARAFLKLQLFSNLINSDKHPTMRVQALDGIWEMVGVDGGV